MVDKGGLLEIMIRLMIMRGLGTMRRLGIKGLYYERVC